MNIVRTAAQKISAKVVCYSSVGNREWAEGLAREVDFIKSDWGALLWSIGSLRVVLDRRPAPISTYDDLKKLVDKFVEAAQQTKVWGFVCGLYLIKYCWTFFESGSASKHAGVALMAVAWAFSGTYAIVHWRTKQKLFANKDMPELIGYYRESLEEQANWAHSPKKWIGICISLLLFLGMVMTTPRFRVGWNLGCIAVFFFMVIMLVLYTRRYARRRLRELDALLQTKP